MKRNNTPARILPFFVAALVVAADRISKLSIQRSVTVFDSISVVPGWVRIIHTENVGAAFGVMAQANAFLRTTVLVGVSSLVLLFVVSALWNPNSSFNALSTRLGLGLILGGAVGNLYDRVLHGTVTDFIEVYHRLWSFPAFNVADSAITVGAVFLLLDLLRSGRRRVQTHADLVHK